MLHKKANIVRRRAERSDKLIEKIEQLMNQAISMINPPTKVYEPKIAEPNMAVMLLASNIMEVIKGSDLNEVSAALQVVQIQLFSGNVCGPRF